MYRMTALMGLCVTIATSTCFAENARGTPETELWPSDSLTKVMRSAGPGQTDSAPLKIDGARGEIVSGQAVFRCAGDLAGATAGITDLHHRGAGATIPAREVKLRWVRYIDVDRNTSGIPDDELVARAPTSIPDPYWESPAIPVKAHVAQPIWIEVRVPREALPGDYEARLTVTGNGRQAGLPVVLHVWDFNVPARRHVSVVNWWSFPGVGFKHIQPYSDEYWDLLRRFCLFLVEHRQTDISTSIGLIQQTGDNEQGFSYNTARLERYAEVAFQAGVRRIHLHSVGRRTPDGVVPQESNLRRLAAWEKVAERRNWEDRFLVSISDEPFIYHEESYAAMVDRAHRAAPSVRCIEAVESEYLGKLDIYVPKLTHLNLWYPRFQQVQREGAELWFYTCCHPVGRYPNRFLDQSLLKVRVLHWINYLYDLDGYLHWGLNHFAGDNPYTQQGISRGLPLGDRAIVYPGKKGLLGSLRFSAMRDGLEDYEYLWVLENELAKIKKRYGDEAFWLDPRQRPLELCRRVIWSFHEYTRDPKMLLKTRREIAEEIEALQSRPVLVVQTSPPEQTVLPAGPRVVNVRGLAPPGATVTLNGKPVRKVHPSGYFLQAYFMPRDNPTITITLEHEGRKRTAKRTFQPAD